MKKLKLNLEGIKTSLTKEEMKKISGGYTGECCVCHWMDHNAIGKSGSNMDCMSYCISVGALGGEHANGTC